MSESKMADETIPGGKYLNAAQDRYEDAWGNDLGPVADESGVETDEVDSPVEEADDSSQGEGDQGETESESDPTPPEPETPAAPDQADPAKATRSKKAAD